MLVRERRERSMLCFIAHHGTVNINNFDDIDLPIVDKLIERGKIEIIPGVHYDSVRYVKGMFDIGPTPQPMAQSPEIAKYLANIEKFAESQA